MNDKKKLELRNKEISKLKNEIIELNKQNDILKEQLRAANLEKSIAFEKTKQMISDLQNIKNIYNEAIQATKCAKQAYLKELSKLRQLRKKIKKENGDFIKTITKRVR